MQDLQPSPAARAAGSPHGRASAAGSLAGLGSSFPKLHSNRALYSHFRSEGSIYSPADDLRQRVGFPVELNGLARAAKANCRDILNERHSQRSRAPGSLT